MPAPPAKRVRVARGGDSDDESSSSNSDSDDASGSGCGCSDDDGDSSCDSGSDGSSGGSEDELDWRAVLAGVGSRAGYTSEDDYVGHGDDEYNHRRFAKALERASKTKYPACLKEWRSAYSYYCEKYGDASCICGHLIQQVCVIRNRITHAELSTGNVCIKRFASDVLAPRCCQCGTHYTPRRQRGVRAARGAAKGDLVVTHVYIARLCAECEADGIAVLGGKHKGRSIRWVATNDAPYITWLRENVGQDGWARNVFGLLGRSAANGWTDEFAEMPDTEETR